MGRGIPTGSATAEGNLRVEQENHQSVRALKTGAGRKPRHRRKSPQPDRIKPIELLFVTARHFFPAFNAWLDRIADPRRADMITYSLRHLLWEVVLMFLGGAKSRNQMVAETLRPGFLKTLLELTETEEQSAAHPDTPYWLLSKLPPVVLVDFSASLIRRLLRMRCLERYRFGTEWLVAVDGTWLRTYTEPHCEKCLHQQQSDGSTIWFHAVLEAKLVLGNGMSFSLASVPIENPGGEYDKQDCEQKAFPRLAEKLKQLYPRLHICLLGDSLYGCAPVLQVCEKMAWSYIVIFKQGRTPALWERAERAAARGPELTEKRRDGTEQVFRWAPMLNHEGHTLHAIICHEKKPDGETTLWAWLTDHRPTRSNVSTIANKGGRSREHIEQQFNIQKNGEFELKHDYGSNLNAWYNYYLLAQIAHMLVQLMQAGDLVRRLSDGAHDSFTDAFRTMRNFVVRMRESIQRDRASSRWRGKAVRQIQIRLLAPT